MLTSSEPTNQRYGARSTAPEAEQLADVLMSCLTGSGRRTPDTARLEDGARRAIALRLAGLYSLGLNRWSRRDITAAMNPAVIDRLMRARRQEIADDLVASRETKTVLQALAGQGIQPIVLKGRPLAERIWPRPWMRPAGDLDLLADERQVGDIIQVLSRLGYAPAGGPEPGRWRPTVDEIGMVCPRLPFAIEVHTRPFRTVGDGIDAGAFIQRAEPWWLHETAIRVLAPADEVLFLLVHAAKHGRIHLKWMLDLHGLRLLHPPQVWARAAEQAKLWHATRPFWASARLLSPRVLSARVLNALRPNPIAAAIVSRIVRPAERGPFAARGPWQRYPLEWWLEGRLISKAKRLLGVLERLGRRLAPCGPTMMAGQLRSQRWLEAALRGQTPANYWITLEGASMTPSIRSGDRILIAPLRPGELREGEVVVVRRNGRLVAHRLVRLNGHEAVIRGDGMLLNDPLVPLTDLLARVIAVQHHEPERP